MSSSFTQPQPRVTRGEITEISMSNAAAERPSISSSSRPFRLAILGGGAVTWEYYLPALRHVRSVEVRRIVDPSPAVEPHLRAAGFRGAFERLTAQDFFARPDLVQ